MPLPANETWTWARHHLLLSNSRQAWEERAGLLILILGALGLFVFARGLPLSRQVLLWGLLLVVLAVLLRRGWLRAFGPVLFYDLLRGTRRGRYFLLRFFYTLGLGLVVGWSYYVFYLELRFTTGQPTIRDQAVFAERLFYTFMWVQFLVVVLLTPAYTAGAIADEKDRRTLEFLLATDLENREIVLGKWTARVGNLALLLLAGLPVLALNLFMGGVDPDLMIAGFTATAITLVSLAAVSIALSVHARKARDAIVLAYLVLAAYYALSTVGTILVTSLPGFGARGLYLGSFSLTIGDVVGWFSAGNIFIALFKLMMRVAFAGGISNTLPDLLREYAIFHGLLTLGCVALAVVRLRAVALAQHAVKAPRRGSRAARGKPAVGNYAPMVWKEVFADRAQRGTVFGRIIILLLVCLSFLPLGLIIYFFFEGALGGSAGYLSGNWERFGDSVNAWVRGVGAAVASLVLLGVGVRAAGSLSGERDKQTFDALLTTPLTTTEILWGKWLGSLSSVRWGLVWLGLIWLIGAATGGLQPVLLIPLLGAWLLYAAVIALIGLWFSLVSKTTLRATVWTVVTTMVCGIGHWLIWSCCVPFAFFGRSGASDVFEVLAKVQVSLSPPLVLGWSLPWRTADFTRTYGYRNDFGPGTMIGYAVFGLIVWGVAGLVLWGALTTRFSRMTRRGPGRPVPRRRPPVDDAGGDSVLTPLT